MGLVCLIANNGAKVWHRKLAEDYKVAIPVVSLGIRSGPTA